MADEMLLQDAIDALGRNETARARVLLTKLIKSEPNNPTYWLWLSAAVTSRRERLYCLQTVMSLDPQNASARRGLILLGAVAADESVMPFPLNHPRLWEEKLTVKEEKKPHGLRAAWTNPSSRLFMLLGLFGVIIALVVVILKMPGVASPLSPGIWRFISYTPTVTSIAQTAVVRTATPTYVGPTPLRVVLGVDYSPTPLYVSTEHPPISSDTFSAGIRYMRSGDYNNAASMMLQVATYEPEAVDAWFYRGEIQRLQGDYEAALVSYQTAINLNPSFGPAYYGRAVTRRLIDPEAEILTDLDQAILLDPMFSLAYIHRAMVYIEMGQPETALFDVNYALSITPDSPLAYLYKAEAYLVSDEPGLALTAADRARQLDQTYLPAYLMLGRVYLANEMYTEAVGVLQTYILYLSGDATALVYLGTAYNGTGDYPTALDTLDRALTLNNRQAEGYYQRGIAYLNLGQPFMAQQGFESSLDYRPDDFKTNLALARAYLDQEHPGTAYSYIEQNVKPLALTDREKAEMYYYEALTLEAMQNTTAAVYWRSLLNLPQSAVPTSWREAAMQYLQITPTPSPTPTQERP